MVCSDSDRVVVALPSCRAELERLIRSSILESVLTSLVIAGQLAFETTSRHVERTLAEICIRHCRVQSRAHTRFRNEGIAPERLIGHHRSEVEEVVGHGGGKREAPYPRIVGRGAVESASRIMPLLTGKRCVARSDYL